MLTGLDDPFVQLTDPFAPTTGPRFQSRSIVDLAQTAENPEWIVDKLIVNCGLTLITGLPKIGKKTWLCLDLAKHLVLGLPWLDRATIFPRRTVIYTTYEEDANQIGWRARALGVLDQDTETRQLLDDCRITFGTDAHKVILEQLENGALKDIVWILETLADPMSEDPSLSENDSSDMTRFVKRYADAARRSNSAIVTTHHFRKAGDAMRGSVAIAGKCDGWIEMHEPRNSDDDSIRQMKWRLRYDDPGEAWIKFVREDGRTHLRLTEKPESSSEESSSRGETKKRSGIYRALRQLFCSSPERRFKRAELESQMAMAGLDASPATCKRVLNVLRSEGLVAFDGLHYHYAVRQPNGCSNGA